MFKFTLYGVYGTAHCIDLFGSKGPLLPYSDSSGLVCKIHYTHSQTLIGQTKLDKLGIKQFLLVCAFTI